MRRSSLRTCDPPRDTLDCVRRNPATVRCACIYSWGCLECDPPGKTFVLPTPRPIASPSCRSSRKPESCRPDRTQRNKPR
eukprot:3604252-Rhodomonas_salina.1